MAEGLRIRLRPEAIAQMVAKDPSMGSTDGRTIVISDHTRPFPPPIDGQRLEDVQPICSLCLSLGQSVQHFAKTYHIQLRPDSAIVSSEVWEGLERLHTLAGDPSNPFELVNAVAEPPAQGIEPWSLKPVTLIEKFAMPIRMN